MTTNKTKPIESELDKLVKKLKKDEDAVEHFGETEQDIIVKSVENNNVDLLTPRERQLIYAAYNKIKQGIQKTNEKFPLFKKVIIVVIAAIIIYLIWKILKKIIKKGSFFGLTSTDDSNVSVLVVKNIPNELYDELDDSLDVDLSKTLFD